MPALDGKSVIVTGAGSGIGRASALALGAAGALVVVADIDAAGGEETVSLLTDGGAPASFVKTDVTDAGDVERMVEHAVATYGRLDAAHNNAGILGGNSVLTEVDDGEWRRVIELNLTSVYLCMKHEILAMLAGDDRGRRAMADQQHLCRHCATAPPSTGSAWPFTNDAASEHSQTTASPTSFASASLRIGETLRRASSIFGLAARRCCIISVRTVPGQTAFTRMPLRPYSMAAALVSPTTPCFDAT